jgi:hypothetical protein
MSTRRGIITIVSAIGLLVLATSAGATSILVEDFDDVGALAGWTFVNNSNPPGTTGWFQGNPGVFPSQSGAADAYIASNFENAALGGNVSNWLLTPELSFGNGDTLGFYTRTAGSDFPDRLEVRLSTNGGSSDVGATDLSVGDFSTLLLTVNPTLAVGGYPDVWTLFTLTLSGLPGPSSGRFAFRYFVPDTSVNADYIGIDTVVVDARVPEPSSLLLLFLGAAGILRRRSNR